MSPRTATDQDLSESERSQTQQEPPPTFVGWGVRVLSVGLVLALLGYLVLTGMGDKNPAILEQSADDTMIAQRNGQWVVPVVVTNRGDVSVSDATVSLSLVDEEGNVVESENVSIPLLGQSGAVDVEYWFDHAPGDYSLRFETGGFTVP